MYVLVSFPDSHAFLVKDDLEQLLIVFIVNQPFSSSFFLSGKDVWRLNQEYEAAVLDPLSPVGFSSLGTRLCIQYPYHTVKINIVQVMIWITNTTEF